MITLTKRILAFYGFFGPAFLPLESKSRISIILLLIVTCGFLLFLCGCSSKSVSDRAVNYRMEEPVSGAVQYGAWMLRCLEGLESDLDRMIPSAETAARLHVEEKRNIGADGERGAVRELVGRSGGMMRLRSASRENRLEGPGIVLYFLRPGILEEDIERILLHKQDGSYVIVFGAPELIKALRIDKVPFDEAVSNRVPDGGGLFRDESGQYFVPLHKTANAAVLWVWLGEFLAACTRLGSMPLVYQGFLSTGGLQYAQRHIFARRYLSEENMFYEGIPEPVAPGVAGREFLIHLRRKTELLVENETDSVRAVSLEAAQRITGMKKGRLYSFLTGHSILPMEPVAYDPDYFEVINSGWENIREDVEFAEGDFLFHVGYCWGGYYSPWVLDARRAGVTIGWSFSAIIPAAVDYIMPDEYIVDQHWGYDDAVVQFPGFELKILPTSGFLSEAVLWMTLADIYRRLEGNDLEGSSKYPLDRTSLHTAVLEDDLEKVKNLLREKQNVDARDAYGFSALHIASYLGNEDILHALLKEKPLVSVQDSFGRSPLHIAVSRGNIHAVNLLIESGAVVNLRDKFGENPIHRACRSGFFQALENLLSQDVSAMTIKCIRGRTPLHLAAEWCRHDAAKFLIDKGADVEAVDNDGLRPLHFASSEGRMEEIYSVERRCGVVTQILIDGGADISARDRWGRTPLHWAAGKNNKEAVKKLLEAGAVIDSRDLYGRTPLFDAANSNAYDVLELLLRKGADPSARCINNHPPHEGSRHNAIQLLDKYMEKQR